MEKLNSTSSKEVHSISVDPHHPKGEVPDKVSVVVHATLNSKSNDELSVKSQNETDTSPLNCRVEARIPTDERVLATLIDVRLNPVNENNILEPDSETVIQNSGLDDGIFLVLDPQDPGQRNRDALLCTSKATVTLSTAASASKGLNRSITLKKKENGEEVEDSERQAKVDEKFMDLKQLLGLGQRPGYEKAMANYSISWHFIQVNDAFGERRYDLLDKHDIARLLQERGLNHSPDDVERVYHSLLGLNRDLKKLVEHEAGKEFPSCVHDYFGNQNGPRPFIPYSSQFHRILNQENQHGRYLKTLERLNLIKIAPGKTIFSSTSQQLTKNGAEAYSDMDKAKALHEKMLKNIEEQHVDRQQKLALLLKPNRELTRDEIATKEALNSEIAELQKIHQEIASVNLTVVNITLMELNSEFSIDEPEGVVKKTGKQLLEDSSVNAQRYSNRLNKIGDRVANDVRQMVQEENRTGWIKKKDYQLTKEDETLAVEVAAVIYMVGRKPSDDPARIDHLDFVQSRGVRRVSQMPIIEDLLINSVIKTNKMNSGYSVQEDDLRHFEDRPEHIKAILRSALIEFAAEFKQ